uniref:Signal recognition particle receptor FtsY n=1 Tax=Magnetococcus massalia (strain MO-1) TaxID=451514 RepID=A0A1S7LK97_MAGMO|nr:cell division protein FtsY (Signal recognition particle) [Candidatus Magnetococcus massalia]
MALFSRLREGLAKTRDSFSKKLDQLTTSKTLDEDSLEELEDLLIMSDFGVETAQSIIEETRARYKDEAPDCDNPVREMIKIIIRDRLRKHQSDFSFAETEGPHILMVVGVNGVGKTTTIGKLSCHFKDAGHSLMLAAGDTFRAAAVSQLKVWGERTDVPVIAQGQDADSASVIFDAYASAQAKGLDLLIADTAGRLHTKSNLMEELKKIQRVLRRQNGAAPHDIWLVLDATTGQNAVNQVKSFHQEMGLTGLVITKLDGTAKGGVVVGISEKFNLPIHYIGIGEGVEDLRSFEADAFVDAMFDDA